MAVDKLVDSTQLDADLTSVANAIRTKGGTSAQLAFPAGFVSAVQAIPTGQTPTGTKNISITANGVTTEDVTNYASAQITANIPNTYAAADEGKVVSNGALVAQGSDTVTQNDTYDTTLISSLTVNVSGGGNVLSSSNLLSGCTFSPGYVNTSGGISSQSSTNKEVVTNEIDISNLGLSEFGISITHRSRKSVWGGIGFYKADHSFISRAQTGTSGTNNYQNLYNIAIPNDAAYMRVSFRTYGDATVYCAPTNVLYDNISQALINEGATNVVV